MLSATFGDRGGGANDPAFSVDLTRSRAIFRDPEILYIIRGTCCTSQQSQGDPDSSFPSGCGDVCVWGSDVGDRAEVIRCDDIDARCGDVVAGCGDVARCGDVGARRGVAGNIATEFPAISAIAELV